MVMGSRSHSETTRQAVVAMTMAAAFGLAMGAAWLQVGGLDETRPGELVTERLGPFVFERPADWTLIGSNDRSVTYGQPGRAARRILIAHLSFARPVTPPFAAEEFVRPIVGDAQAVIDANAVRAGPFVLAGGTLASTHGAARFIVATIDGQEYLAINALSPLPQSSAEPSLFEPILKSLRDARFRPLGQRLALPIGMSVEVPGNLAALGFVDDADLERVVFHPRGDARFAVLRFVLVDLTKPPPQLSQPSDQASRGERSDAGLLEALIDGYPDEDPATQLLTHMFARYLRATDRFPPPHAYGQFELFNEAGYLLVLRNSTRSGFEALWGMPLGADQAALISVVATLDRDPSADAAAAAQQSAQHLIQALAGSREPPAVPQVSTPTNGTELPQGLAPDLPAR